MSTATDKVRAAMHALEDEVKALESENNRLSTIYATIRVNATRHGATGDEIEQLLDGRMNFVAWMHRRIAFPPEAENLAKALRLTADRLYNAIHEEYEGVWTDAAMDEKTAEAEAALKAWARLKE